MSGRIRSLKPEVLEDSVTAGLSDTAFRMFIAAIVLSDDYGHFRAEVGWLRGQVYWARDVDPKAFARALDELSPLVQFYVVNGQRYGAVRNWSKHQRVDKPGKPRIPGPPEVGEDRPETLARVSRDPSDTLVPDLGSRISDLGEGSRTGSEPEAGSARATLGKSKPRAKTAGTRLPVDWKPSPALLSWAKSKGIIERDVADLSERFLDHWLAADHAGAFKADWDAAFRTWARRDIESGKVNATPPAAAVPVALPPTPAQLEMRRATQATLSAAIAEMNANAAERAAGGAT